MCLISHAGKVLVADGDTMRSKSPDKPVIPSHFYGVLGGSIDFAEKTEDAVRREIREELHAEVIDLKVDEPDYEFEAVRVSVEQILKGQKPLYPVFNYASLLR